MPRVLSTLHTVSFLEFIDTTTGINQLLLTREEGMAVAANINLHNVAVFRRARLERRTASAYNRYFVVFGMDISLHIIHLTTKCHYLKCFPIITLFLNLVNCFCANL